MQPSESLEGYRAAVELRERLLALPLAEMREAAMVVIRHRVPDSIEDKVARHLVALIQTIEEEK